MKENDSPTGIILNEEGYHTYFKPILDVVGKTFILSHTWRITNAEILNNTSDIFENNDDSCTDLILNGEDFYEKISNSKNSQWVWGTIQAFPKDIPESKIAKEPPINQESEQFYKLPVAFHHSLAILELGALDSSATYVISQDADLIKKFKNTFPNWEPLEKIYV